MTRREITENRIIQNILLHNDPKDLQLYNDLYISTRPDLLSAALDQHIVIGANGLTLAPIVVQNYPSNMQLGATGGQLTFNKSGFPVTAANGSSKNGGKSALDRPKRLFNNSLPKIVQGASRNVVTMLHHSNYQY